VKVVIMPAAGDDLRAAYAYYAERNPDAAGRVIGAILNAANGLARFPLMGRQGALPGTRERIVRRYPYKIVYQIVDDTVEVLRVIHTAQQWP
jgi:addiction module RelE/StbE family toxin